jgi:hypothetical protein
VSAGAKDPWNDEWTPTKCQNACFDDVTCKVAEFVRRSSDDNECYLFSADCTGYPGYNGNHGVYAWKVDVRSDSSWKPLSTFSHESDLQITLRVRSILNEVSVTKRIDPVGTCAAAAKVAKVVTGAPTGQFGLLNGVCVYLKLSSTTTTSQISNGLCSEGRGGITTVSAYMLAKSAPTVSPPTSCSMIKLRKPSAMSGMYTLSSVHEVYCDFSTDNGGWTMIAYGPKGQFGSLSTSTSNTDIAIDKDGQSWVSEASASLLRSSKEMAVAWTTNSAARGGIGSFEKAIKFDIPTIPDINIVEIGDTAEILTSASSYIQVLGYASESAQGSSRGSTIAQGALWGAETPKLANDKAWCRCVAEDNSKGLSRFITC